MTKADTALQSGPRDGASPSHIPALLDHLVWLAGDLDAACAQFEAASGVTPTYGGAHASGTHNALVSLGEEVYLEIAAPVAGAQAGHPWVDAARRRSEPHLYAYCMRSAQPLATLAQQAKAAGMDAFGPLPGSRTTPQGQTLEWQLFIPVLQGAGGVIPFLIDWQDTPHPAEPWPGEAALTGFELEHPEPERFRPALAVLAPGIDLKRGAEEAALTARITTPRGIVTLVS
ncbi:MAG: VOC family protein [Pseudomonadota bacterium]